MNLGDRMKIYEDVTRTTLIRRMPTIIRLDGVKFSSLTRKLTKPYDLCFVATMDETAICLCSNIQNCRLAYIQSDEISLLLIDYATLETEPWFGNDLRKLVSVSSSMASACFNSYWLKYMKNEQTGLKECLAAFDSRAWNLPMEEVCNYFIWRQQDATRNSIQSLAQANFSHKSLHKLNNKQLQEKLFQEKGINWNDCHTEQKRGRCVIKIMEMQEDIERSKWIIDREVPIFTQDRKYIEDLLTPEFILKRNIGV